MECVLGIKNDERAILGSHVPRDKTGARQLGTELGMSYLNEYFHEIFNCIIILWKLIIVCHNGAVNGEIRQKNLIP